MRIIKRRAKGGSYLHFLEGQSGAHAVVALCGLAPTAWRYPGEERDNMAAHPGDCPKCVDRFIKAGGQFS